MWIAQLGIAVAAVSSIVAAAVQVKERKWVWLLMALTIVGSVFAIIDTQRQQGTQNRQAQQLDMQVHQLDSQAQQLKRQAEQVQFIEGTVGNLAALKNMSGGAYYYVRLAVDTKRERLVGYLNRITNQFKGANSSGMVSIRKLRDDRYELVFGQHLDLVAAEVFQRLAMSHHLVGEGQVASIHPE